METDENCVICSDSILIWMAGYKSVVHVRYQLQLFGTTTGDLEGPAQVHQIGKRLTRELNSGIPGCKASLLHAFYIMGCN